MSKEIKFVDFATPSFRQQYAKADLGEKADLLIEREQNYERKHRQGSSLERADGREIISPTLQTLIADNPSLLPERQSACQVCRVALWFVEQLKEGPELKVFCPKMNSIIYETANPVSIPLCDGMIQAEEEAMQEEE